MTKMYWINGIPKKTIALDNRALHFGDGFFTTAKLKDGTIDFLDWHMDRLICSARRLMFNDLNFDCLYKEILQAANHSGDGVIKVIISRINHLNKHGYAYSDDAQSLRIIRTSQLPTYCTQWNKNGVRLKVSAIRLSRNSFFAGIKHLNRLEQVMIASTIDKNKGTYDALVLDTDDNVVECCNSNIFWRKNHYVFTPSLSYAGVKGVMRRFVLQLLPSLGYCVQEVMVGIETLKDMDEIFITNSLLPLASIKSVEKYFYSDKTLFNILNAYIAK